MKKLLKNLTIILAIAFMLSLIPIIQLSPHIYAQVDDFSFSRFTHVAWVHTHNIFAVIGAAFKTIPFFYTLWQGTYTSAFLMSLEPGIWNQEFYHIVPMLMIAILGVATFWFVSSFVSGILKLDKYISSGITLLILMISFQCIKQPAEAFTWYNGAIHYTGIYALWLILLTCNIKVFVSGGAGKREQVGLCLLAFLVAGGNNLTVLTALIVQVYMLLLLGIMALYKGRLTGKKSEDNKKDSESKTGYNKLLITFIPESILMFVGAMINFLAPGNAIRMEAMGGNSNGIVETIVKSFSAGVKYSFDWTISISSLLFIAWLLPFAMVIIKRLVDKFGFEFKFPLLLILAEYCLFSAMWAPNIYTSDETEVLRTQNFIYLVYIVLLTVTVTYLMGWVYVRLLRKYKITSRLPLLCGALVVCATIGFAATIVHAGSYGYYTSVAAYNAVKSGDALQWAGTIRYDFNVLEESDAPEVRIAKPESGSPVITCDEIEEWRHGLVYYYEKESVLYDFE
ncbi:hypothetical protein [Butyrivibrio fibrisolvens]|uniref:Uncharacterized protein n=1 Tax=Butyrivibrio fibrisolvens TaxID=831 RepID=A0A317FY84_BUTFI|nr:hypothetical protein [Butyrivibrio fibrisolvens]PWT26177.1 hypothetical protein CPT75_03110 [Butyrivibrio fibrisolvens]